MSKPDEKRQKPSVKGFLAWVNADEELNDEAKMGLDDEDEDFDESDDELETEGHQETPPHLDLQGFHATLFDPEIKSAKDYNWDEEQEEEELAALKADDSILVDYEGDDEFDYPDEIIVIDEFVSIHDYIDNSNHDIYEGNNNRHGVDQDDVETDYADSIPIYQEAVHMTKKEKRRLGRFRVFYLALSALVALNVIGVLLITVNFLPPFGGADNPAVNEVYTRYVVDGVEETGALNMVSAVLYSYRSFDTLGEAFVLFTAAIGVIMLLQETKEMKENKKYGDKENKNRE